MNSAMMHGSMNIKYKYYCKPQGSYGAGHTCRNNQFMVSYV